MKQTVLIAAKKTNDSAVAVGIHNYTTADYNLAISLIDVLKKAEHETLFRNTDDSNIENDKVALQNSGILIVIALSPEHLSAAKKTVEFFQRFGSRKIIFLYAETLGSIRETDLQPYLNKCNESEAYGLNAEKTLETFAKYIQTNVQERMDHHNDAAVLKKLRWALPLAEELESVTKREWLDNLLDNWILSRKRKQVCWLNGEHGSGKTFFIGDYCTRLKEEKKVGVIGGGIYYCRSSDSQTQSIERIIQVLAYELCLCVNGYEKEICETVLDDHFSSLNPENLMRELLIDPFNKNRDLIPKADEGMFVFAIDGIDELKTDRFDALTGFLDLLLHITSLPKFIRIIITSTPDKKIENTMQQLAAKQIDLTSDYKKNQKQDAERFLRSELDVRGIVYTQGEMQKILERAEWNFDYLQHFIAQCDDDNGGRLPPLDQLPYGLLAMYESDFERMFGYRDYQEKVKPILQVLAVTYEPLSLSNLEQILDLERNEVNLIISGRVRQFLRYATNKDQDGVVSLYNASLEKWLTQKNHPFGVDSRAGREAIVHWIRKGCKDGCACSFFYKNDYLQKHGLYHLLETNECNTIKILIEDSSPDDFEKLKSLLGSIFVREDTIRSGWNRNLFQAFQDCYGYRVRDILVYIYRYILKRRGTRNSILRDIYNLLCEKGEKIRAELLWGEGIEDYSEARCHFKKTIEQAEQLSNEHKGSEWWDVRMLGVACNRLANLENKHKNQLEAKDFYEKGKKHFEQAKKRWEEQTEDVKEQYKADIIIIERDLGIICERLGDLAFGQGDYGAAEKNYQEFYNVCNSAYKSEPNLRNKWDLSISLLRLGDAQRCQGKTRTAQNQYTQALELRREILQHMRSDCMDILPSLSNSYFVCPETDELAGKARMEMIKESRDIDPIRDIAMCYARLGDLAYSLGNMAVAAEHYDTFVKLCEKYNNEVRTKASENDLRISRERRSCITEINGGPDESNS